jgi:hypothetical protein
MTMKRCTAGSRQQAAGSKKWFCCLLPAACCLLAVGCMGLTSNHMTPPPPAGPLYTIMPTAEQLVAYLNKSAAKVNSLECKDLDMDIKGDQSISVRGTLFCEKPRNFRLLAKRPVIGGDGADFGSNEQEFWYWISQDKPPDLYHCSYADLARGNVRLPFPLHPDWLLEALGVAAPAPVGAPEQEQASGRTLEVRQSQDKKLIYLYEKTTSIQGQPVTKVTTLNNFEARGTTPQVVGHYLYDSRNQQKICQATISKVQYDAASGAIVPQKIDIEWPAMHLTLAMTLSEVVVNDPTLASNAKLFTRPRRPDVHETDLARLAPMMTPTAIQRAGAQR